MYLQMRAVTLIVTALIVDLKGDCRLDGYIDTTNMETYA